MSGGLESTGDEFARFDGAYVLGALSDADRDAFEAHLVECDACRANVRALHDVARLLGSVPAVAFAPDAGLAPASPDLLPSLVSAIRTQRRRRRWVTAGVAGLAAACLIVVTAFIAHDRGRPAPVAAGHPIAMTAVTSSPIQATADLDDVGWGTRINLRCTYDEPATAYPQGTSYWLVVTDKQGNKQMLGTWAVLPGRTMTYQSGTALHVSDIAWVSVTTDDGTPLLELQPK